MKASEEEVPKEALPVSRGFDEAKAGKVAECDGGGHIPGTHYAGRQEFTGTLTGDYYDHGDPPWRWYLMVDLVVKPAEFDGDAVWCLQGNLYPEDDDR